MYGWGRHLVLPGLVNAHSHAFQRAFRGHVQWKAAGKDDFWSWRDRMYATANRLDPEGVQAVSALAFLEMVKSGITHVGEFHYLHHAPDGTRYEDPDELAKRVLAAAEQVGLRITLLRVAYARAGVGKPLRPDQARFGDRDPEDVLAAVERLSAHASDRVRIGLGPHSVRALDADWLRALGAYEGIVHTHVSEQRAENEACRSEHGASPLQVLADAGLVGERFTAVHLTWPRQGDVQLLEEAGGSVCACPTTELDLGDGFLPAEVMDRLPVCVGSDSHAVIDLWQEMRSLELHARANPGPAQHLGPRGRAPGPRRAPAPGGDGARQPRPGGSHGRDRGRSTRRPGRHRPGRHGRGGGASAASGGVRGPSGMGVARVGGGALGGGRRPASRARGAGRGRAALPRVVAITGRARTGRAPPIRPRPPP